MSAQKSAENSQVTTRHPQIFVTFLTGEYPPMQGGIADHTAYLADSLAPLGVESSVLTSQRWLEYQPARSHSDSPNLPISHAPPVHPTVSNWGWRCWPATANFLNTYHPDLLHIQYQAAAFDLGGWINWLPWYLKRRRLKTRIVTTFHDLRVPYIFPKAGPLRQKSILTLARHSHGVICTNQEDYNQLAISNEQLTKEKSLASPSQGPVVAHIPLGSNVEPQPSPNFERAAWRAKYRAGAGTLLLAYFGFLNQSKGGDLLVEALARLRQQGIDARLLLIGGDVGHADPTNTDYAQKVQAIIQRFQLADFVHRTGFVTLPEVSAHLLAADAVVMPYRDGVSFRRTTLIAALRHGCPVVSTRPANLELMPEIEPGQNLLLAAPGHVDSLVETIAPLAGDLALRERLAKGAKQLGSRFEWDEIAAQTAGLYRSLLKNG